MNSEPTPQSANFKLESSFCLFTLILLTLVPAVVRGQEPPPLDGGWSFPPHLNSWSFVDTNTWQSDHGDAPVSFTNLDSSLMGDIGNGRSLLLDSPNPAWLHYRVQESSGATNLTVDAGSMLLWFAPNWASATTNQNGAGPGDWGRLIEVGAFTTNADYGWWGLCFDPGGTNLYFAAQTNSSDGVTATYVSATIDWATNEWHSIALTYSATNTALYLDGQLAAEGAGVAVFPGPDVLTNGFWMGSDSYGFSQARGLFDDIYTFDYPLDAATVAALDDYFRGFYSINIFNVTKSVAGAPSSPAVTPVFRAVSGAGWLQWAGSASSCVTSDDVWLTNVTSTLAGLGTNQTAACAFEIAGGTGGWAYDVFATAALGTTEPAYGWAWVGAGIPCNRYVMSNLPPFSAFLILGTPTDSDRDGLTDAYEKLVSHTDPTKADTSGDGLLDGWAALWGLDGRANNPNQAGLRRNYTYDGGGWLQQVSGVASGAVSLDDEGNVQQVSQ